MATPQEAFVTLLAGTPDVTALVGTRIAPIRNQQRSGQPSISYQEIGASNPMHLTGRAMRNITLRVDCWSGVDQTQAQAVATAVFDACHGYRGTQSGVFLQKLSVRDSSDNAADPINGDDVGVYCKSLDIVIVFKG